MMTFFNFCKVIKKQTLKLIVISIPDITEIYLMRIAKALTLSKIEVCILGIHKNINNSIISRIISKIKKNKNIKHVIIEELSILI